MFSIDVDQLERLTDTANTRLQSYFKLFGFPVTEAPQMTPAMVIAAIEAGKSLEPPASAPERKPAGVRVLQSDEEWRESILAHMRSIAHDGYGPSMAEWDAQRLPGMAGSSHLTKRMKISWIDLIEAAGLKPRQASVMGAINRATALVNSAPGEKTSQGDAAEASTPEADEEPEPAPVPVAEAVTEVPPATPGPAPVMMVATQGHTTPEEVADVEAHVTPAVTKASPIPEVQVVMRPVVNADPIPVKTAPADAPAEPFRWNSMRIATDRDARSHAMSVVKAELLMISRDGMTMPTMTEWDNQRSSELPKAAKVLEAFGMGGWGDLAERANLKYLGRGGRPPVLQHAQSARQKEAAGTFPNGRRRG